MSGIVARPRALAPQWKTIPEALRAAPSWVLWRYELREGKWTKPPRRVCGDGYAKTTDPTTWAPFDDARRAASGADGVGLVLTDDLVGVDLDHVLDDAGDLEPWAAEVVEQFIGCYVERSPGGDGLRIFCRGVARHSGKGGPGNRCEVYGKGSPRYLTVTGHRFRDGEVIHAQAALDWLHGKHMVKVAAPVIAAVSAVVGDDEVLRRARAAGNGAKFARLFAGDAGQDHSSADASLVALLSFWTQDAAQIDRLFRRSGLMREKWDERRGERTYGEHTIAGVLAMPGERYRSDRVSSARVQPQAPQPLPPELLPVDPFPLAALPDAFRPWVADVADLMQCPPDFAAVPILVAAASLVARRVAIRPQRRTDWTERGNLWALIVGRPGVMKSPAMAQALAPMVRLEARAADAFNDLAAQHRADALADKLRAEAGRKEAAKVLAKDRGADVAHLLRDADDDEAPTRPRYVVNDLTYEKLGEVLTQNPDGVLSVRDEVRGLLLHLAREESAPARAFYLQAWSGGRYTFDRIGRGTVTVPDARLSIIGGIQPGPLCELVRSARRGAGDDGMIERFLIAWPDSLGQWREVDRWPESAARRAAWEAFDRLDALNAESLGAEQAKDPDGGARGLPFVRLDGGAREAFSDWHAELQRDLRAAEAEGLEGALSKFRHHVPALALLLHVVDGGVGAVTKVAMLRALSLGDYFASHARRLHASGRRLAVRGARLILDKARGGELPAEFTERDVYRPQWAGLTERSAVAEALDLLTAHGWLTEAELSTGGRPKLLYSLAAGARHG